MSARHLFDRAPHELNIGLRELGLREHRKVAVEVILIKKHVAVGFKVRITPGAAGFLQVVFKRCRNVIVNDQSHVFFVHAHPKSVCGSDHLSCPRKKRFLMLDLKRRVHLAVVGKGLKAFSSELFREFFRALGA